MTTMMKSGYTNGSKGKGGGGGGGGGRVAFELKSRVIVSLNKLADRDTHQIGVEELDRIIEGLSPEGISTFLSCIVETDSQQKSAVRKECVRIMASLARVHGVLLLPHLGKIVASIINRLKDSDSVVRDACLEAVGVLATCLTGPEDGRGVFDTLSRPLFEALGEQNKYVQAGAAFCLARVVDEASDLPLVFLQQILIRAVKLLKSQHFMAKPALIDLIRSVVQAGGATTENALSASVNGILDTLKSNDWTTRKAASVALANIAAGAESSLVFLRNSCLLSLDSCRFDKVKPVRDSIIYAIECWKALPAADHPEPSESGLTFKENSGVDDAEISTNSDSGWRDTSFRKVGQISSLSKNSSTSKRTPLTTRRSSPPGEQNHEHVKSNILTSQIPKQRTRSVTLVGQAHHNKEDYPSTFDFVSRTPYHTKAIVVEEECPEEGNSAHSSCANHNLEGIGMQERNSMDSTITELSSYVESGGSSASSDMSFIKTRLLDIETKQSNVMDLLKALMGNSTETFTMLQLKINSVENSVEKIAQGINLIGNCPSMTNSLLKQNPRSSSSRLSARTSKSLSDSNCGQPSSLSSKNNELCENESFKSGSSTPVKEDIESSNDRAFDSVRNPKDKWMQKNPTSNFRCSVSNQAAAKESKVDSWRGLREFLYAGDLEPAYAAIICSGDELGLIELMNKTGPVLDKLSPRTIDAILNILTIRIVHRSSLDFLVPWLQQVVELSSVYDSNHLIKYTKSRIRFISALKDAAAMENINPVQRLSLNQIVEQLSLLWRD